MIGDRVLLVRAQKWRVTWKLARSMRELQATTGLSNRLGCRGTRRVRVRQAEAVARALGARRAGRFRDSPAARFTGKVILRIVRITGEYLKSTE